MKAGIIVLAVIVFVVVIIGLLLKLYLNYLKKLKLNYNVDFSKKIIIEKNLPYKVNKNKSLMMDIYRPEQINNGEKLPVIIFLHGEGIERMMKDIKEWNLYTSYGRLAAIKGFVGVTFQRSRTNLNFDNSEVAQDILDAVDFVRRNSDRFCADENKICLWSFSLGSLYLSSFIKDAPKYIRCLVSYYGLMDIRFKLKKLKEEHRIYEIENYLPDNTEKFPPFMLIKAEKDTVKGVNESIDHFVNAARERHLSFKLLCHRTGRHSFEVMDDNDETREIIDNTWEFINRNMQ